MGIESRDYYRDPPPRSWRPSWRSRLPDWPMHIYLIAVTVTVYAAQLVITRPVGPNDVEYLRERLEDVHQQQQLPDQLTERFPMGQVHVVEELLAYDTYRIVNYFELWRLVTGTFSHRKQSLVQIIVIMGALFLLAEVVESRYGPEEFLLIYLAAALANGLAQLALDMSLGQRAVTVGAAGPVFAVGILHLILAPRETVALFSFEVPAWTLVAAFTAFHLFPVAQQFARSDNDSPLVLGVGGAIFGLLYYCLNLRLLPLVQRASRSGNTQTEPRVPRRTEPPAQEPQYHRAASTKSPATPTDDPLDDLLRKVHEHGADSLSEAEQEQLAAASRKLQRKYKNSDDDPDA